MDLIKRTNSSLFLCQKNVKKKKFINNIDIKNIIIYYNIEGKNMNNKNLKIIVLVLTIIILGLTSYIIYDKVISKDNGNIVDKTNNDNNIVDENNNNDNIVDETNNNEIQNQDSSGKIYIKRNGVIALEEVPSDIVGKYVNKEAKDDYFILNSDGTAMVNYPTGGNEMVTNNELTFQLTYTNSDIVVLELYTTTGNQPYSPIRIGRAHSSSPTSPAGYTFSTTEHTPTANLGELVVYERVENK